eukprot:TRINITY_DN15210_c0_g1_i1.p1 TRINITY_DN15210_c0_g1~~TRINITY_DN15210_c0_g1_i1.p1  ORF type:complete len:237 (-),score=26.81 TRINITY_DN15210_c0_g1_i1:667-1323(-)
MTMFASKLNSQYHSWQANEAYLLPIAGSYQQLQCTRGRKRKCAAIALDCSDDRNAAPSDPLAAYLAERHRILQQAFQKTSVGLHVPASRISEPRDFLQWLDTVHNRDASTSLCNTVIRNANEAMVTYGDVQFVLPANSDFLTSDLSEIHRLREIRPSNGFQVILMDPPWENKSAQRSKRYSTLAPHEIATLPILQLADPRGCLVCIWVTNNSAQRSKR